MLEGRIPDEGCVIENKINLGSHLYLIFSHMHASRPPSGCDTSGPTKDTDETKLDDFSKRILKMQRELEAMKARMNSIESIIKVTENIQGIQHKNDTHYDIKNLGVHSYSYPY